MQCIIYKGNGERVDTRLSTEFNYSRNFFHHIIAREGIKVNATPIKKSYKLKPNDKVYIDNLSRYLSPILLEESPEIEIPILKETAEYLILNKPKGVLSHPNSIRDVNQPSVVGFLYHHFKHLPSYSNFIRAGLIHRLDKETDGLMIIAKTEAGLQHFKQLFQAKSEAQTLEEKEAVPLQKFYRATCEITPAGATFLQEVKKGGLPYYLQEDVVAKVSNRTPKIGITKIEQINLLKSSELKSSKLKSSEIFGTQIFGNLLNSNLLKSSKLKSSELKSSEPLLCNIMLQILTGRTHQIRYHLSHHGLPIVGDYLYGKEHTLPLQLSAYKLIYQDIDGNLQTIEI